MTAFNIDLNTTRPNGIFVEVDHRFEVGIERTGTGLSIRIYPRTDAELWDEPFTVFEVNEAEITALEADMGAEL